MSTPDKPDKNEKKTESAEGASAEDSQREKTAAEGQREAMFDYFSKKLSMKDEDVEKVLENVTLEGVAKYIKDGKCKNIITMAGAGISTSAGIPDFRSPDSGLYANLQQYDLPSPEAIFAIEYFKENPKPFFHLAKELYPGMFKPTVCHYFLKMLDHKRLLLRHYTQNIDTLEREAGMEGEKLVEAHGTFHRSHCLECKAEYSMEWMKEVIFRDEVPKCSEEGCDGIVKPDIVFFGEALPPKFFQCSSQDMEKCDLLIILGTSLVVQPFASLTSRVPAKTPRLYINLEKTSGGGDFFAMLFGGGFKFDAEDNYRDVFWQGTCDDGCQALADLLGWGDRLKEVVAAEHARIQTEGKCMQTSRVSQQKLSSAAVSSVPAKHSKSETVEKEGLQYYSEAADMIDIREEDMNDIDICLIL